MLFPPEIINNSVELHHIRNKVKSKTIYITVISILCIAFILLPFISVNITTQAHGIIKSPFENIPLQSVVYAQITKNNVRENAKIEKGDTLLIFNSLKLNEQIARLQARIEENIVFIADINSILKDSGYVQTL